MVVMMTISWYFQEELDQYEEVSKHGSYHEYHDHEQNLNYPQDQGGGGGHRGSRGGGCGEVGGSFYGGEEYKNGETAAYDGFENGEVNYKSKGGFKEAEYGQSNFEENTDLEECQYQEKEEKVMMMLSMMMMIYI